MTLFLQISLVVLTAFSIVTCSNYKINKITCESFDKNFSDFEYCHVKVVSRHLNYISLKALLYDLPISNASLRLNFMKRANGWKPFLYDIKLDDICEFAKLRSNPIAKLYFDGMAKYSNMNHTCPYNHHLIVEKLTNQFIRESLSALPMPSGDYVMMTTWFAYNVVRAQVNVYVEVK